MKHFKSYFIIIVLSLLSGCSTYPINPPNAYIPYGFEFTHHDQEIKTTIIKKNGCLLNAKGTFNQLTERLNLTFEESNCTKVKGIVTGEDKIYGIKPKVILHSLKKQEQYLNCLYRNQLFCDFNDSAFKSFLVEPNTKVYLIKE